MKLHEDQLIDYISYSQGGEDLLIAALFYFLKIEKPSYIDIGAHHPMNISNTHLLYTRGSRGINVEANPKLMEPFHEYRPEDINLNIGVALKSGMMTFYRWDETSGRNTFSEYASKKMEILTDSIDLPVTTLDSIIREYCQNKFPDFLSIDIEGLDYDVLSSTDISSKVICVEVPFVDTIKFMTLLKSKGYSFVARVSCNMIFIRDELKDECGIP